MKSIARDHKKPHIINVKGLSGKEATFEFCPIPEQDYCFGKYPVTQQQWEAVMGNNPSACRLRKNGSTPAGQDLLRHSIFTMIQANWGSMPGTMITLGISLIQ